MEITFRTIKNNVAKLFICVAEIILDILVILIRAISFVVLFLLKSDCKVIQVIIKIGRHVQLWAICGYILLFMKCLDNLTKEGCKMLVGFRIIPATLYQQDKFQEDEGVLEMRALLRGEDYTVRETSRVQYQVRPMAPQNINPHREFYMASIHYKATKQISYLYTFLKEDKNSASEIGKLYFETLDDLVSYLTSYVAVNRRS